MNYTEQVEVHHGKGNWAAGMAVEDQKADFAGTVVLDGALDVSVDWAVIGLEIRPLGGRMPAPEPSADETPLGRMWSWLAGQLGAIRKAFAPHSVSAASPPPGVVFRGYYYVSGQQVGMRVQGEAGPAKNGLFYLLGDHSGARPLR